MSSSKQRKHSSHRHTQQPHFQQEYRPQANAQQHTQGQMYSLPAPGSQHYQFSVQSPAYNLGNGMSSPVSPARQHNVAPAPAQFSNQFGLHNHSTLSTTTTTTTTQMMAGQQHTPGSGQDSVQQWLQPPMQSTQQPMQQPVEQQMQPSLMQQPIPQSNQMSVQQPSFGMEQKFQCLSQASDYTQRANPAPLPPVERAFDYTQLATMPPVASQQAPITSVSTSTQTTITRTQRQEREAQRDERRRQRNVKQSQLTVSSSANSEGGKARQAAAAKGEAELRQFDQRVQLMLQAATGSICDQGFQYYRVKEGYLCGGGVHFVTHKAVDDMCTRGIRPAVEIVNDVLEGGKEIAPPADGWHEPMHWSPAQRIQFAADPMPLKYDGTRWDLRPFQGYIDQARRELQEQKKLENMLSGLGFGFGF